MHHFQYKVSYLNFLTSALRLRHLLAFPIYIYICHTPIFNLRSYIHTVKNSAERYFKIPHFFVPIRTLFSLYFYFSFYFTSFYFILVLLLTLFNKSKITCPCPKKLHPSHASITGSTQSQHCFFFFLFYFAKTFPTLNCIHHHLIQFN